MRTRNTGTSEEKGHLSIVVGSQHPGRQVQTAPDQGGRWSPSVSSGEASPISCLEEGGREGWG